MPFVGSAADDPSQHDRPLPSELAPGAAIRVTGAAYWYREIPVGTTGVVVRVDVGSRRQVVADVEIAGSPFRVTLPDDVLVVVGPPRS